MPPSIALSLFSSSVSPAASFLGSRSKSPASCRASSWSSRPIRFLIVTKLVIMPPSQRLVTYGWPERIASCITGSCACFLVPTNSTLSPRATVSVTNSSAVSRRLTVWARSMMWIPLRSAKMNGRILGFHRRVWWPKWTPASSSWRIETVGTLCPPAVVPPRIPCGAVGRSRDLLPVRHRPARDRDPRVCSVPADPARAWYATARPRRPGV